VILRRGRGGAWSQNRLGWKLNSHIEGEQS